MNTVSERIIEYIRENRVSTTEVADCLGKSGVLRDVSPITRGRFCVGEVYYCCTYAESNWPLHEQIQNIQKNKIVFIDAIDCGERAVAGELVSKYLLLYMQSEAIITNGFMRDAHRLIKEQYNIWCKGVTPIGCFNTMVDNKYSSIIDERAEAFSGSIAVCDDSGVVIIPKENHNESFLDKLKWIENQEDIWFDCIDRKKWNTFQTVCLKEYMRDNSNE